MQLFIVNRASSPYKRIWRVDELSIGEATALNVSMDKKQSGFLGTLQAESGHRCLTTVLKHCETFVGPLRWSDDQNTGEMQLSV